MPWHQSLVLQTTFALAFHVKMGSVAGKDDSMCLMIVGLSTPKILIGF
jgi:hypothetical protein